MERKIVSIVVILAIAVSFFCCRDYMSSDNQIKRFYDNITEDISNAVLYDLNEDKIIFEKHIDDIISVGSIVKVLSVCVSLPHFKPEDTFLVGEEVDYYIDGDASRSMIRSGQTITYEHLLCAILLPSGSDAVHTLAVNTARKITNNPDMPTPDAIAFFCDEMNRYAEELGCTSSHFANPDGQDNENQYTCISDLIIIAKKALESDLFRQIVGACYAKCELVSGEIYDWYNTNEMVNPDSKYYYEGAFGIKTGFTSESGYCLMSCAEKNGKQLLCIICNCNYKYSRFTAASRLFTVGFFADTIKKQST